MLLIGQTESARWYRLAPKREDPVQLVGMKVHREQPLVLSLEFAGPSGQSDFREEDLTADFEAILASAVAADNDGDADLDDPCEP